MIQYNVAKCLLCDTIFNVWGGVGFAERQQMSFLCPECGAEIHVTLVINYKDITAVLESSDIELANEKRDESRKGVNIYSDLPVRKDRQGVSLPNGGSAFLDFAQKVLESEMMPYNTFKIRIQHVYDIAFHAIRRTAILYNVGNYKALSKQLKKIKSLKIKKNDSISTIDSYHSLLCNFALPHFDSIIYNSVFNDVRLKIQECKTKHLEKYNKLVVSFWKERNYKVASKKLVETFIRFVEKFDALILGASFKALENRGATLEDYMTFRSDFSELTSAYVDGYELAMQYWSFMIPIYNLSQRGASDIWSNGKQEGIKSFSERTSSNKEFAYKNEPELNNIYEKMNRKLRNSIGHYDIHYDAKSRELIISDKRTILLSAFMNSYNNVYNVIMLLFCFERMMRFEQVSLGTNK